MKDINTFLAIVDSDCSYTKAEEIINLSQPAISKRIKRLEHSLRCKLFNKVGHRMVLTQQGLVFLEYARKIKFDWNNATSAITRLNDTVSGTLNLVASNHMANYYLAETLRDFKIKHPDVNFNFKFFHSSDEITPQLLENKAELGLMIRPQQVNEFLTVHTVGFESLKFVVSAALYPEETTELTIKDLTELEFIRPKTRSVIDTIIDEILENNNFNNVSENAVNSCDIIRKIVASGMGCSLLPERAVDKTLRIIPFEHENKLELVVAHHKDRILSNSASAWIELMTK